MEYLETMEMSRLVERVHYSLAYNEESNSLYYIDFDTPEEAWNLQELNNGEDELENSLDGCEAHAIDVLKTQILRLMPQEEEQNYTEMESGLHFTKHPDGEWSFTYSKGIFSPRQCEVLTRIETATK